MRNKGARFSDPNSFVSDSGSRYKLIYSSFVNSDGSVSIVPAGKKDLQAEINSFLPDCDLVAFLAKLRSGLIKPRDDLFYGDFSAMPKSYAEWLQLDLDSRASFDKLPADVRQKFDFDRFKWLASAGSDDWFSAMGFVKPDSPVSDSTVKDGVPDES